MAVLPHEGKYSIMYGSQVVPIGKHHRAGYLARPDEAGQFPTVILVPGANGLTSFDKDLCRRLARQGLACLAVDIYPDGEDPLAAYQLRGDSEMIADLDETYDFIQSDEVFWAIKHLVGVIGFDVGGRFALILGVHRNWVGASCVVSTPLTGDEERSHPVAALLASLARPVLGLYGAVDQLIASETIDEAQRRNERGLWLLYDGAGHGFFDDSSPDFHPGAAADVLARISKFFLDSLPRAIEEDLG